MQLFQLHPPLTASPNSSNMSPSLLSVYGSRTVDSMMNPKCQFETREGLLFCNKCGIKFEIATLNAVTEIPLATSSLTISFRAPFYKLRTLLAALIDISSS